MRRWLSIASNRLLSLLLCSRSLVAGLAGAEPHVIWQEAESLAETGGWSIDSQHVDLMGSPYLLATGVGRPVADAVGQVTVPSSGPYRLWVRCRDWYPSHSPGRFGVSVGGMQASVTFGKTGDDSWQWVDGGSFELGAGQTELRLTDQSGWWGRCDAVVLASGAFVPSNEPMALAAQRLEFAGVSPEIEDAGQFDVVVVGGGSSGLGAAIAAARNGIKVAFVQDRPVLGGNGSSEIMVPPMGWIGPASDKVNVTGIAEEIFPVQEWSNFADSDFLLEVVERESNISLFLNTRATVVEMKDKGTIAAVIGINVRSGQRLRFAAPLFIDTTGHGWIGYYAGAEWRMGTEGRGEFNESLAPAEPTPHTMGNSLYRADFRDMGKPDPFETPKWACQWDTPEDFHRPETRSKKILRPEAFDKATRGPGRPVATSGLKRGGAFTWFVENGGMSNTIDDAERIRDELFRIHVGLWGYTKNRDPKGIKENRNMRMVWLNYVPGVRESRRLVGDYIMTQTDWDSQQDHRDLVAFTDWGIDDHQPHGFFTWGIDAIHVYGGQRVGIPFRSLYSKNVGNLFMAGRCMSASHMALGGVRVQRPMTATGQAVGTAAAIATRCGVDPRGVYENHLVELQQTLLKDGCFLPGVKNEDPLDLARKARTRFPGLIDGWNREIRKVSKAVPWHGTPLEFRFPGPERVSCVHLSLTDRYKMVRFAVEAMMDGAWKELAQTPGTAKQRRYVINLGPVETDRMRFRLIQSSGPVAVAEVRIYSEPGVATHHGLSPAASVPGGSAASSAKRRLVPRTYPGIVVDDLHAKPSGNWVHSNYASPVVGTGYQHDGDVRDGRAKMTFAAQLPKPGLYELRLAYVPNPNRATNVPVSVTHADGRKTVAINQREKPPIDGRFVSLGTFRFSARGVVEISNEGTNGYVIADGVQWLSAE